MTSYSNFKILKNTSSFLFGEVDEKSWPHVGALCDDMTIHRKRLVFKSVPYGTWRFLDTGESAPESIGKLHIELIIKEGLEKQLAEAKQAFDL